MQTTAFVLGAAALGAATLGAAGCSQPVTTVVPAGQAKMPPEVPAGETNWLNGRFTFEDARGQVVLIEAWHPSCGSCLDSVPAVHALADRFGARGLRVFTVTEVDASDRDEERRFAAEVASQHGITYATLLDDDARWMNGAGIDGTPTFLVVDRQGRIVLSHRGVLLQDSGAFRTVASVIDEALAAE